MPEAPGVVALDAMGVLYAQRGISPRLVALAARCGVTVQPDAAREAYRRASRGQMDSTGLWAALGVAPEDAAILDGEFLAARVPQPGLSAFLERMANAGIRVGCITNDVADWFVKARRAAGLDGALSPWIVSAEVGVRKPAREIYEAFLAATGSEASHCLFVDDTVENLDAAAALGFATAWFTPRDAGGGRERGAQPPGRHRRVTSFEELAATIIRPAGDPVGMARTGG